MFRKMRKALILFSLLLTSCNSTKQNWIDRDLHEGLYRLEYSDSFETYSTSKEPSNLRNTINNLEQAKTYFDNVFNEDLNFAVLFIENENWNKYAFTPPPGMPQAYLEGNIVLGLEKSIIAKRAENQLQQFPESELNQLSKHFGNKIDLDLFYRDALAIHELGHLYQFYKIQGKSQRKWLDEFFGALCQVAAAKNLEQSSTFDQMDSYQKLLVKEDKWGDLPFKSLEQFENNYFEIMKTGQNYGWYQIQFYFKAKELYSKYGDNILKSFMEFLIETNPRTVGKINNEELNQLMMKAFDKEVLDTLEWKHDS